MRTICVFTGSRSEYGILKGLIQKLNDDFSFRLKLLVSGSHLSPEFGLTYHEIERDGFKIDEKVITLISADTSIAICKSIGLGLIGYSEALERIDPDILLILGDRFEALAVAIAALSAKIPIAHIHGGESTIGAVDDAFRHAITKMSYIHLASTEVYRQRVIQLGEDPQRVYNVGALGVENCKKLELLNLRAIEKQINFQFGSKNALITFHPETLGEISSESQFRNLLAAIDHFNDIQCIFTKTNPDSEGRIINRLIDDYCKANPKRSTSITSMGQLLYLSALSNVDVVIGNSSSGIIEAPSLKTPTVNIGIRQQGRVKAESILDCESDKKSIMLAIENGIKLSKEANESIYANPYDFDGTSNSIIKILKTFRIGGNIQKKFFDIPFER